MGPPGLMRLVPASDSNEEVEEVKVILLDGRKVQKVAFHGRNESMHARLRNKAGCAICG